MDLSFFSSSPCSDFASFDDDDEVLLELLLLLEAAPSRESIPRKEEEEEEEPFPNAAIRLGRTPLPLMLLPATEGEGDRDDTANATMAVAHTAPIALPYALLCDADDDFFVDSSVVLARPPSLSIKEEEEEPSKVCVSSDVVFMMMILIITTTSFFLSELFDRESARALLCVCLWCADRGLENEERRGRSKKSTKTLNKKHASGGERRKTTTECDQPKAHVSARARTNRRRRKKASHG
jgi:hypothetical protein